MNAPPIKNHIETEGKTITQPWVRFLTDIFDVVKYLHVCDNNPNGNIVASVGHVAINRNGGANTVLWVKESGTNSTGWASK